MIEVDDNWKQLKGMTEKIIKMVELDKFEECLIEHTRGYSLCFEICNCPEFDGKDFMYTKFKEILQNYLEHYFNYKFSLEGYSKYNIFSKWMCKCFLFLDRQYLSSNMLLSLHETSMNIFKNVIFQKDKYNVYNDVMKIINDKRDGLLVDKTLIKQYLDIIRYFDLEHEFSIVYIKESNIYFKNKSDNCGHMNFYEYLEAVENFIVFEEIKIGHQIIVDNMVMSMYDEIVDKWFCQMLTENRIKDIHRLLFLLENKPLDLLSNVYGDYLFNKAITNKEIHDIIEFHKQSDLELKELTLPFSKTFAMVFIKFFNTIEVQLVSEHCDKILKKTHKFSSDDERESQLFDTISLVKYISDKDVFCHHYSILLSRRLLLDKSVGMDLEKFGIHTIATICDRLLVSKIDGMLKDMTMNSSTHELENNMGSVKVLTFGNWPTMYQPKVNLPIILQNCKNEFESYYHKRYSNRKLHWINSLGSVILQFGKYSIHLSTLQSIIVLKIQDSGSIFYNQLQDEFSIEDKYLKPLLHSLSCGKYKLINKTGDSFEINTNFSSPLRVIKMPSPPSDEIKDEVKKVVTEDRKFVTDSIIVRIMKVRKFLKFNDLIPAIQSQNSSFNLSVKFIKERLESLVERDYIKRNENDVHIYEYIA